MSTLIEKQNRMKFEVGSSDCMPFVEVLASDEGLIVSFWGFCYEEAEQWFNSEAVLESVECWHEGFGDFVMTVKSGPLNRKK